MDKDRDPLLLECRRRLRRAKVEIFRMQDIADALVRTQDEAPGELELRSRLQEARDWIESADRQLMELGAYRLGD